MNRLWHLCLIVIFAIATVVGPTVAAAAPKDKDEKAAKADTKRAKQAPVDINSASTDELQKLPGIGEAYAQRIVKNRPYERKTDLVRDKVIPQTAYDKIKNRIVARGGKSDAPPAASPRSTDRVQRDDDRDRSSIGTRDRSISNREARARGLVWVSTDSGVYHHEGDHWYGKTKEGRYMTEAEARRAGYRESKNTTQR